jgi:hypothetical protein
LPGLAGPSAGGSDDQHSWAVQVLSFEVCVMRVYLVNPSHLSFGVAVITPRWLFVLAAATPAKWGDPII